MKMNNVFAGIKIADFSWVGVGPQVARELAEHGATVVRIECHRRPDTLRLLGPYKDGQPGIDRSGFGMAFNTNKHSISVDLNTPEGLEVANKLVMWADIVCDSMTPKAMRKWGLDYESLKKIKPDIIMYSTNQHGQYGPFSSYAGYGNVGATMAGFDHITGWPDREPAGVSGAYTDFISPWFLATALIAALAHRHKTGKGTYLDQAQRETGVNFLASAILDYTVNGRVFNRDGNRFPSAAPHSAYPCLGDDRWIAISVFTDEEWRVFCQVIGQPEWVDDPKFLTLTRRKENEDELNQLVGEWTRDYTAEQVMVMMQAVGVTAGVVQTSEDLFNDPQLKQRWHFRTLNHTEMGPCSYNAPAYRLSKTPSHLWKAPPCLGEDNEYVFKEILGFSDEDIADLLIKGVITTPTDAPPGF